MEAQGSARDDCSAKLDLYKYGSLCEIYVSLKRQKNIQSKKWIAAIDVNRDQTSRLASVNKMNKKLGVYPPSWKIRGGSGSAIHRNRVGKRRE